MTDTELALGTIGPLPVQQRRSGQWPELPVRAVMSYQRTKRLPLTGIVTTIVWDALITGH